LNKITIWGVSSILCALIPTMSLAATSPAPLDPPAAVTTPTTAPTTTPAAVPPATPNVGEITQSATTTTSACKIKATSAGCINGAVETLGAAGVKFNPGTTAAIKTATTLANFNPSAQIQQLNSNCSNISDPMACASSAQSILSTVSGLGIPGLSTMATNLNASISKTIASISKTLAGVLGQGGDTAPTTKQVEATNPNNLQTVATQSLSAESAAKIAAVTLINSGTYTPGVQSQITSSQSQALATATLSTANLQAMKTNTDLAAQATTDANTVAGTTYDNSLDAINATNQSLAGVVAGQERIYAATTNNTLLQAQNLKQLAANYQATDAADRQKNTELSSVVSRNGNAACYIASITNAAAVCNK
jgi:hypothetical protein